MQQIFEKRRWSMSAGLTASVTLHCLVAALLIFRLPDFIPEPQSEPIAVELIPPPEESQAEEDVAEPAPQAERQARLPQAFESASQTQDESATADTPPAQSPVTENTQTASSADQSGTGNREAVLALEDEGETSDTRDERSEEAPAPDNEADSETAPRQQTENFALETPELSEAEQLYSEDALSNPHIKAALGKLPPNRRIVQICAIEALEQVRSSVPGSFPDMLVPYMENGGLIEERVLTASGGAYRSLGRWYGIDFRCELNEEANRLISFRYQIRPAIPESEWVRRKLPAGS